MFDCFKTFRNHQPEHIVIDAFDGASEAGIEDSMESASARHKRPVPQSDVSTHVDVRSILKTQDGLRKTIEALNEAIKTERSTWRKRYKSKSESGDALRKLIEEYDAGYQELLRDREAGAISIGEIEHRATALGTLLARIYGLATETGWTDETKRRCKEMGDAYVYPSVFINDLSSGLLIAKTLLGLILDVLTMGAPAHAVAFHGTKIAVNLSYAVLQSFVTCCMSTVGSGTHQSKVYQETLHLATEFMPDQPTTSYTNMLGNEAPPPSLPHVKKSLRLVNAVVSTLREEAGCELALPLLQRLQVRRDRVERAIAEKNRKHPEPTGHQKLELKRLGQHLGLIKDLLDALKPVESNSEEVDDSSSGSSTDSDEERFERLRPDPVRIALQHKARLSDELAVADRLLRANVQHHVGNGKWWRSMFNMGNGLASVIKAGHEIVDGHASGYDFGIITAGLVSTALTATQVLLYRCTQGSASGEDHCAKIASLFALIGQTRRGDLRSAETGKIDPRALDKLVIGPRMTRMSTLVKGLTFNSAVRMLAIVGHIKSSVVISEARELDGYPDVALTFLGLQREFNALIKAEKPIDGFVAEILKRIRMRDETQASVERLLQQIAINDRAVKACKEGKLSDLDGLLAPVVMKVLVGALQHAQHLYSGNDYDAYAHGCDERLIRWGAETEIRVLTGNGKQISAKGGPTFSNLFGGNGSFFAVKAVGTAASSGVQLMAGIDSPSVASDWIDLVTAVFSCCGPACGSTSGYAYRTVKLKNEGRAADKEADVIAPPNSGIQMQGEHDFMPVFSLSTLRRQADNFDTLIAPFIAPEDIPPPFDYECEVSVMRDMWEQMTKPQPLFSSKVLKKWAGPPFRKPGSLDPNPQATLGTARQRNRRPVNALDDLSSGSDSEEAYDIGADPKAVKRTVKGTDKTPDEYVEGLTAANLFA
jgi:hypothetical protein